MNATEIIRVITENLRKALDSTGVPFSEGFAAAKDVSASRIPCGAIEYNGESFDETIGARPPYAEAEFAARVFLKGGADAMQSAAHGVRDALTVEALNAGFLAADKPVSRVTAARFDVEADAAISILKFIIRVRYRAGT